MTEAHAQPPADDEPKTPLWLPAIGAALFVGAALVFAVSPPSAPPASAAAEGASAVAPASGAPSGVAVPVAPSPPQGLASARAPGANPVASAQQMNDRLRQLVDQMRQQGGQMPGGGQPQNAPRH